jgi:hypothetical protein
LTKENQADKAAERHHQKYEGGRGRVPFYQWIDQQPSKIFLGVALLRTKRENL